MKSVHINRCEGKELNRWRAFFSIFEKHKQWMFDRVN